MEKTNLTLKKVVAKFDFANYNLSKPLTLLVLFYSILISGYSQFNYQAAITDVDGSSISNNVVIVKFSLIYTSNGTEVYVEKHTTLSNVNGIINLTVGEGQKLSGIEFSKVNYLLGISLKTEIDINNSGIFKDLGTQIIKAVPIATNCIDEKQELMISGNKLFITNGSKGIPYSSVDLPTSGASNITTNNTLKGVGSSTNPLGINTSGASNGNLASYDASTGGLKWVTAPISQTISFNGNTINLSSNGGSIMLPYVKTVNASSPLQASIMSNNLTISIPKCDATNDGYLSSTDYNNFTNNGIKFIDNNTISNITLNPGDYLKLGALTPNSNINIFKQLKLVINGGSITGTGNPTVSFSNYSTITGVSFTDCKLSGYFCNFIGCTFNNVDLSSTQNDYSQCIFSNISSNMPGFYSNCQISSIAVSGGNASFNNCLINSGSNNSLVCKSLYMCELQGTFTATKIESCNINSSILKPNFLINNKISTSWVDVISTQSDLVIEGNIFSNAMSGKSELINIDYSGSSYRSFRIQNNTFTHGNTSNLSRNIYISGTHSGFVATLAISGNSVSYSSNFISNSSNAKIAVNSYSLINCNLGISNGGNNIVQNNSTF